MTVPATQEFSLDQMIRQLENQLISGDPNYEDFKKVHNDLLKLKCKFQGLLQWAAENQRGRKEENKFKELYRQVAGWNASDLIDKLKQIGFALRKNSALKDAFDRQGYRILELVRVGKRDEAFHAILRIFVSSKKDFPSLLVEAFKPAYSDELFKIFLFSFLSGILSKEETEQETQ
jgi:hypothetical protein